jgi:hypothetical protein
MQIPGWRRLSPEALRRFAIRAVSTINARPTAAVKLHNEIHRAFVATRRALEQIQIASAEADSRYGRYHDALCAAIGRSPYQERLRVQARQASDEAHGAAINLLESHRRLANLTLSLSAPRNDAKTAPVNVRSFLGQLRALEAHFPNGLWVPESKQYEPDSDKRWWLGIVTDPIVFFQEQLDLGPFLIYFDVTACATSGSSVLSTVYALALRPNPSAFSETTTHPFVRNEHVCLGQGQTTVVNCRQAGLILPAFQTVWEILRKCGRDASPYITPARWYGDTASVACACGEVMLSSHAPRCRNCRAVVCLTCAENQVAEPRRCATCEAMGPTNPLLCGSCSKTCRDCGAVGCRSHTPTCAHCGQGHCSQCHPDQVRTHTDCAVCHTWTICASCYEDPQVPTRCPECDHAVCATCVRPCQTPLCTAYRCATCYEDHRCATCRNYICEDHVCEVDCHHTSCSSCSVAMSANRCLCSRCGGHCQECGEAFERRVTDGDNCEDCSRRECGRCGEYYAVGDLDDDGHCADCGDRLCECCERYFDPDELNNYSYCEECADRPCTRCDRNHRPDDLNNDGHCAACADRPCARCERYFDPDELNNYSYCENCADRECERCGEMRNPDHLNADDHCEDCADRPCDRCCSDFAPSLLNSDDHCAACADRPCARCGALSDPTTDLDPEGRCDACVEATEPETDAEASGPDPDPIRESALIPTAGVTET